MSRILFLGTFTVLCCLLYAVEYEDDQCRQLDFRAALAFKGKRLLDHVIKVVDIIAKDFCGTLCFMEPNCVSYNILVSSDSPPITKCELNDATHFEHPSDLVLSPNSTYRGSKNACIKKPCSKNYVCQAGFSSEGYRCVCAPGYKGDDCAEVDDECSLREHKCDSNANCVNAPGSHDCKCKEGFLGDGRSCTDIDECALEKNNCTKGSANCTNTAGSFNCTCQSEHFWNGQGCEDVDECSLREHKCDSNANCENAPGSYDCKCKEGFLGDGRICTDIDECALEEKNCTKGGANCTNAAGSFNCTCKTGYFWNGQSCEADGCYNYSNLSDANRKSSYVTPNFPFLCDDQLPKGWYRFVGAAGTKMPTTRVPEYRCGTRYSGWLDGAHPSVEDGEVVRKVCFSDFPKGCKYSKLISVKNCGSYHIYKLHKLRNCNLRYCGTD